MHIKTLVTFRSKSVHLEEMAVVSSQIPAPETIWDPSVMTEEKIQALVEHGLLRPKAEVEWKAPTGEAFRRRTTKSRSSSRPSLSTGSTCPSVIASEVFYTTTS
jgi:hypothetical protein